MTAAIPVLTTGDANVDRFAEVVKQNLDVITGQQKNAQRLSYLAADADTADLINTINALLYRLQSNLGSPTAIGDIVASQASRFPGLTLKAWVHFNASGTILASSGIATVVRNALGQFTVTYSAAMDSVATVVDGNAFGAYGGVGAGMVINTSCSTTTCVVYVTTTAGFFDPQGLYLGFYEKT